MTVEDMRRLLIPTGLCLGLLSVWPVSSALAQSADVNLNDRESQEAQPAEQSVVATAEILFTFSAQEPRPDAADKLREIAALAAEQPDLMVRIDGYTDNRGWSLGNIELSRIRTLAVARALMGAGVELDRMNARAFGESRPVASNATAEGRARNRRVEVSLMR